MAEDYSRFKAGVYHENGLYNGFLRVAVTMVYDYIYCIFSVLRQLPTGDVDQWLSPDVLDLIIITTPPPPPPPTSVPSLLKQCTSQKEGRSMLARIITHSNRLRILPGPPLHFRRLPFLRPESSPVASENGIMSGITITRCRWALSLNLAVAMHCSTGVKSRFLSVHAAKYRVRIVGQVRFKTKKSRPPRD